MSLHEFSPYLNNVIQLNKFDEEVNLDAHVNKIVRMIRLANPDGDYPTQKELISYFYTKMLNIQLLHQYASLLGIDIYTLPDGGSPKTEIAKRLVALIFTQLSQD